MNKFKTVDVVMRWKFLEQKCLEAGIKILGISGDGDARILKGMKIETGLGISIKESFIISEYFNSSSLPQSIQYVQDTVHIITKLRNRLLR